MNYHECRNSAIDDIIKHKSMVERQAEEYLINALKIDEIRKLYNVIKDYFKKLENSANGAQFDKGNKSPAVFAIIAAALNFIFAVVAFISGVFVDGLIYLANTAYLVSIALYAMSVHKDLLKTSFD